MLRRYHEGATNLDLSPECLTSSLTAAETHIQRLRMPSSSHWDQDSTAGLVNVKIVLPFFYTHQPQNFSQFPSAPPTSTTTRMIYPTVYPLLFCFLSLLVLSEEVFLKATSFVSLETGDPLARCDGFGLCETTDGWTVFGETMEKYLSPPSI